MTSWCMLSIFLLDNASVACTLSLKAIGMLQIIDHCNCFVVDLLPELSRAVHAGTLHRSACERTLSMAQASVQLFMPICEVCVQVFLS